MMYEKLHLFINLDKVSERRFVLYWGCVGGGVWGLRPRPQTPSFTELWEEREQRQKSNGS
jgi:hypothetical protein